MAFLLVAFIVAQFVVLNLAGLHGPIITELRTEQEQLKLDNDLKRAEINALTKSSDLREYAQSDLGLVKARVQLVEVEEQDNDITAINN